MRYVIGFLIIVFDFAQRTSRALHAFRRAP